MSEPSKFKDISELQNYLQASHSFSPPEIENFLIKCLKNPNPLVRGKALGTLGKIWKDSHFLNVDANDLIIACWNDGTYWIREVASELLRLWSESYPLETFQKMKEILLLNIRSWSINDPATGNEIGEYVIRFLLSVFIRRSSELSSLNDNFKDFIKKLRELYDVAPRTSQLHRNIVQIMMYITSCGQCDSWSWDEATEKLANYIDRPQKCWTCKHWKYWQVPEAELRDWLKSTDYANLKKSCFEEDSVDVIDPTNGSPFPRAINELALQFTMFGYCMNYHEVRDAVDHCDQYLPRQLKFPIKNVLVELSVNERLGFLVWAKVDAIMREQVQQWLDSRLPENSNGWYIASFLEAAALKCDIVRTRDGSKKGSLVSYKQLYHWDAEASIHECIFMWDTQQDPAKFFLSDQSIGKGYFLIEDLESILRGKLYAREVPERIHAKLWYY